MFDLPQHGYWRCLVCGAKAVYTWVAVSWMQINVASVLDSVMNSIVFFCLTCLPLFPITLKCYDSLSLADYRVVAVEKSALVIQKAEDHFNSKQSSQNLLLNYPTNYPLCLLKIEHYSSLLNHLFPTLQFVLWKSVLRQKVLDQTTSVLHHIILQIQLRL